MRRTNAARLPLLFVLTGVLSGAASSAASAQGPLLPVDDSGFRGARGADADDRLMRGGVAVERDGPRLRVRWTMSSRRTGRLVIDLRPGEPLIQSLGVIGGAPWGLPTTILNEVEPVAFVTVGSRRNPPGRPPSMGLFNVFFDSPAQRPHQSFKTTLDCASVRVTGDNHSATVAVGTLSAGPFRGEWRFHVYQGAKFVHVEAALKTDSPDVAFVYDTGLVSRHPGWNGAVWYDTEGKVVREELAVGSPDRAIAVRYRTIALAGEAGSIACFPPPHQFFYPRDLTDNQATVWIGRGHRGLEDRDGFGIRQTETGGGNFVPWFNAPPGTEQRLGVFYLLSQGPPGEALVEAIQLTRRDRFPDLAGHVTLSSHWHLALAVAALREKAEGRPRTTPDLVAMFKEMNVDIVHLAEFHGDGHPQDPGPVRLAELDAMFEECRRLSDDQLLVLPGEEANVHLGVRGPGQHPGHWLYLFPRPVHWTMTRRPDQPFVESDPVRGKVYHVGDAADMARLIEAEGGLAWTAHPRIKASNWAPDAYRDAPYFRSDSWLGAAWKAMPADLSRPRLGERVLDLLDDMANWGARKYAIGEVDVFKIDRTHELYGHMNINYLRLDRVPRYDEDWTPVLDALGNGRFFVSTGEVLIPEFQVGGKRSGETAAVPAGGGVPIRFEVSGTFPLRFAELISGDGRTVHRHRIDLRDVPTGPFALKELTLDLKGRTWARLEVWDVAANGAFTQPVWLETGSGD